MQIHLIANKKLTILLVNSQATTNPQNMQVSACQQTRVKFMNGKTFYVNINSKNESNQVRSLPFSKQTYNHHLCFSTPSPLDQLISSNTHIATFSSNQQETSQGERLHFKQPPLSCSHHIDETAQSPKLDKTNKNNLSSGGQVRFRHSFKKHRIFEDRNNECNGMKRSHTNLKTIKTYQNIQKINTANKIEIDQNTTKPSNKFCFSRSNKSKTVQQLSSYQKPIVNSHKLVASSQPLSRNDVFQPIEFRKTSKSPKERPKFIDQIQSKHYILMQESNFCSTPLIKLDSKRIFDQFQHTSNNKQSKKFIKQVKNHGYKQGQPHFPKNIQLFCEQSTLKVGRQKLKGNIQPHQQMSISNIEQDNSSSRYFDNEDDLLPMLNKVSYKNVEIEAKNSEKNDQMVIHNIFMDFQKAPNSPGLKKKQTKSIVYYDSSVNKIQEKDEPLSKTKPQYKTKLFTIIGKIPFLLIFATIALLIIQITM